jgi:hypothetical protein
MTRNPDHARVCLFSQRRLHQALSRCVAYEFEDVICQLEAPTFLAPQHGRSSPLRYGALNRLARYWRWAPHLISPGLTKSPLRQDYALFMAAVQFPSDLLSLASVPNWRQRSQFAVCWLEELWASSLDTWQGQLELLRQFDLVIVNCYHSRAGLVQQLDGHCRYLPPGVDALRFMPADLTAERPIDVCNIGRRSQTTHHSLLQWARQDNRFYYFDSFAPKAVYDPAEHRFLLAQLIQRSAFFIANAAKSDLPCETAGQTELGFRFFEGAAGGAVLLGHPPGGTAFDRYFAWPDSIIAMPWGSDRLPQVIDELRRQPARLARIRAANVAACLGRHDWVWRWQAILHAAGLAPTAAMRQRIETLQYHEAALRRHHALDAQPLNGQRSHAAASTA